MLLPRPGNRVHRIGRHRPVHVYGYVCSRGIAKRGANAEQSRNRKPSKGAEHSLAG
jgi:hypothetical protein